MQRNFGKVLEIQDARRHSPAAVISLGILLAGTVNVTPDPKRRGFYEIADGSTVYYFYVSASSGTIFLLATWKSRLGRERQPAIAAAAPWTPQRARPVRETLRVQSE